MYDKHNHIHIHKNIGNGNTLVNGKQIIGAPVSVTILNSHSEHPRESSKSQGTQGAIDIEVANIRAQ